MEYTVQRLGKLAGISTRTLRYYDEMGLLKPARINSSGYRIYGRAEVDRLQQILFYRELGVSLEGIRAILAKPSFNRVESLREHQRSLSARRDQLDRLIANVEKSMAEEEGRTEMSDQEKFEGFKQRLLDENEEKYGQEIRERYGEEQVARANKAMKGMSKEDFDRWEQLSAEVLETLRKAVATGDPAGELAQKAAGLHAKWLSASWGHYNKEAHAGLARMYVDDERFRAYYDKDQPGTAAFLRDAVLVYTGKK